MHAWKFRIAGALLAALAFLAGCSGSQGAVQDQPAPSASAGLPSAPAPQIDALSAERLRNELSEVGSAQFTAPKYKPGKVEHVVLFSYTPATSQAVRDQIGERFRALATTAVRDGKPYIASIVDGTQNSGEQAGKDMQHGFIVTFNSEGDRNYYVGAPVVTDAGFSDPAHAAFKEFAGPYLQDVIVFDFIAS
jgi:hypothetical protein